MSFYSTADLLRRCKVKLNRPDPDQAFTVTVADDVWYDLLSEAQEHVMGLLASTAPDSMYNSLTLLTTADSGFTYTFGTDVDTAAIFPYGHYELYPNQNAYPDSPLIEGQDFLVEGTQIRGLGNRTIAAPYARWITPPNVLSSTVEPTLLPKFARILIADKAIISAAEQRLKQDATPYRQEYQENVNRILLNLKTAAFGQGGRARTVYDGAWWRGNGDLGP